MRCVRDLDFRGAAFGLPRAAKALAEIGYSSAEYRPEVVESGIFPDVALDFSRDDGRRRLSIGVGARLLPVCS